MSSLAFFSLNNVPYFLWRSLKKRFCESASLRDGFSFVPQTSGTEIKCSEAWIFFTLRRDKIICYWGSRVVIMATVDTVNIGGKIFWTTGHCRFCEEERVFLYEWSQPNLVNNIPELSWKLASNIILAQRSCNRKNISNCFLKQLPHTVQQYSITERELYNNFPQSRFHLLNRLILQFSLRIIWLICRFQARYLSILIPRSFAQRSFWAVPINICIVFLTLRFIPLIR